MLFIFDIQMVDQFGITRIQNNTFLNVQLATCDFSVTHQSQTTYENLFYRFKYGLFVIMK